MTKCDDLIIDIENYNLSYGDNTLYKDFSFRLKKGEIKGIFGPTGCGKTSLLNKIVDDYSSKYKISYVFQDNKLIKDLTVLKNIILPLENIYTKDEAKEKANKYISLFDLENRKDIKCGLLSGGEKQRVNLARSFSYPCDILLVDEGFSSQDDKHKSFLIEFIKEEIKKRTISAVIVSHNREELTNLCDYILDIGL